MRILVFSDSHGNSRPIRDAIMLHPEADMIIHLGDGERDIQNLSSFSENKRVVQVCGNCDFASLLPANEIIDVCGKRIFCTHGHNEQVKYMMSIFENKARVSGAHIALYGHTHQAVTKYDDGLYIMNPGSARIGEYGIIDIERNGIMTSLCEL